MRTRKISYPASVLALIGVLLSIMVSTQGVAAQGPSNPGVLGPGSQYGLTFGQWGAAWWQWALEQPTPTNPLLDTTGANCGVAQSGPV